MNSLCRPLLACYIVNLKLKHGIDISGFMLALMPVVKGSLCYQAGPRAHHQHEFPSKFHRPTKSVVMCEHWKLGPIEPQLIVAINSAMLSLAVFSLQRMPLSAVQPHKPRSLFTFVHRWWLSVPQGQNHAA